MTHLQGYFVQHLKCHGAAKSFNCTVKNQFSALESVGEQLNNHSARLKRTWLEACYKVLVFDNAGNKSQRLRS